MTTTVYKTIVVDYLPHDWTVEDYRRTWLDANPEGNSHDPELYLGLKEAGAFSKYDSGAIDSSCSLGKERG